MIEITGSQIRESCEALGLDASLTTETHIVVRDGGCDITIVQYALDENGKQYFTPEGDALAKVTTTLRVEG